MCVSQTLFQPPSRLFSASSIEFPAICGQIPFPLSWFSYLPNVIIYVLDTQGIIFHF
jgi:hypothetical protein